MQVIYLVSESPHYNINLKFCLTYFDMMTKGYTQHSMSWWLEIICIDMIIRGYIINGHSDEILGVM